MKVLFYLPVVTPWWFDNVVEPLIRRMAQVAETHVLAPQPWRNTGIGAREMEQCLDLPGLHWAIVDSPDHPSLRTEPADRDGLVAFVRSIDPDYVFCRSADFDTVRDFPGTVRFLMEIATAPFPVVEHKVILTTAPFDHGMLPDIADVTPGEAAMLDGFIAPAWEKLQRRYLRAVPHRGAVLRAAGIDPDRPVLLLPLEYMHEENFFLAHSIGPAAGHALVAEIAGRIGPDVTLAVTNHPLNERYLNNAMLYQVCEAMDNVVLLRGEIGGLSPTIAVARHADGMFLRDSKSFAVAAFFGTPILRHSKFASADWLRVETALDRFVADMGAGRARRPDVEVARRWFGLHMANDTFFAQDPALTAEDLAARADRPKDPSRWSHAMARYRATQPELFA